MNSVIYAIINRINNKIYIGSASCYRVRSAQHRHYLRNNNHQNDHLQRSWNKYGENNFQFKILEYVLNKTDLIIKEQLWINWFGSYKYESGYNICKIAGSQLGFKHSEESKLKMSIANKGRIVSEETRKKLTGYRHTQESKLKIAKSSLGRKHTEETKRKMNKDKLGKKQSEEHIRKLVLSRKKYFIEQKGLTQ